MSAKDVSCGTHASSSPPSSPRVSGDVQVGVRDLLVRIRFSYTARVVYLSCVATAACMVLVGVVSKDFMVQGWYKAFEVILTVLFTCEIGLRMWTQGLSEFASVTENMVEAVLCALCNGFLIAMLFTAATEAEAQTESLLGAAVLSVRHALLLGRLAFFVRSSQTQTPSTAVQLHSHDNASIRVSPRYDIECLLKIRELMWRLHKTVVNATRGNYTTTIYQNKQK